MSAAAYLTGNLIDSSAVLSASTEDPAFGLDNLFDGIAARRFRWTDPAGGYVEADLLAAKAFDTVALVNHNFDPSATLSLRAGAAPNPAEVATAAYAEHVVWIDAGPQNARYVRIVVSDSNPAVSAFGQLLIGSRVALPRGFRFGQLPGVQYQNVGFETPRGVFYGFNFFQRRVRDYTWRVLESELDPFEALSEASKRRVSPFLFVPDTAEAEALYVRFVDDDYRPAELAEPMREPGYDVSIQLREESFGQELAA